MNRSPAIYYGVKRKIERSASFTTKQLFDKVGGNTGNLAFVEGIHRILGVPLSTFAWGNPKAVRDSGADVCVVPCANQFGAHCDMGGEAIALESAAIPVVAIGLGAQSRHILEVVDPPVGTRRWVEVMSSLALGKGPNIALRGFYTYQQLERFGLHRQAVVLGCPSNLISPDPKLGQKIVRKAEQFFRGKKEHIAVVPGHPGWPKLGKVDASLVDLLGTRKGGFLVQDPLEMFHTAKGEFECLDAKTLESIKFHFKPTASTADFKQFVRRHARLFFSAVDWMQDYQRFDFVIGPRIHGVMLALQAGIPAICVAHDSRTRELCEFMKIPMVLAEEVEAGITRNDLAKLFKFDPDVYDMTRKSIASRYLEFLSSNQLPVADYLQKLATNKLELREDQSTGVSANHAPNINKFDTPNIRGCVDLYRRPNVISGWAHDLSLRQPCTIIVKKAGRPIGIGKASSFRPDLMEMNEGFAAFSIQCEESIEKEDIFSYKVEVFGVERTGQEIRLNVWEKLKERLEQGHVQA